MTLRNPAGWGLAYAHGPYHRFERVSTLASDIHRLVHRFDALCGAATGLHRPDVVWYPSEEAPPARLCYEACGRAEEAP